MKATELIIDQTVYLRLVEDTWNRDYPQKRHHANQTRSVILKGKVSAIKGFEFKALLFENNGFEKDNSEWVFHENVLLENQEFTDVESLGVWKYQG